MYRYDCDSGEVTLDQVIARLKDAEYALERGFLHTAKNQLEWAIYHIQQLEDDKAPLVHLPELPSMLSIAD